MHKTQPRMASLDSWELIRSQTWRSTVPRWPAAAVRLLRRSCTAEAANLLLKRRTTRERSKRKTAGMLPERERESERESERARERRGSFREWGMKSPDRSFCQSMCKAQAGGEELVKSGCQNFLSDWEQRSLAIRAGRRRRQETLGWPFRSGQGSATTLNRSAYLLNVV